MTEQLLDVVARDEQLRAVAELAWREGAYTQWTLMPLHRLDDAQNPYRKVTE